jgi:hypothetical protein
MKIKELYESEEEKLTALSQFLIGRADDEDSASTLSVDAFVAIADRMGMSLDYDSLSDMVERGALSNVVKDMDKEKLTFSSEKEITDKGMSVDKARNTVNNMAKRAMNKNRG